MIALCFIFSLIGILLGAIICYNIMNQSIEKIKNENKINNDHLKAERENLLETNEKEKERILSLRNEIEKSLQEKAIIDEQIKVQKESFNKQSLKWENEAIDSYKQVLEDLSKRYTIKTEAFQKNLEKIISNYNSIKENIETVNMINQQKEEVDNMLEFHKINLTEEELSDIKKLRELSINFSNKEVLNKVIWKSYFEKPTNALINRLMAQNQSGIYMLTDLTTDKVYIGQAVNIAERFKQHIKRGLGAEQAINNKLYPAMKKHGVENFAFHIICLCPRESLSANEKQWIEFYKSNIYGLNGNAGG